MKCKCGKPIKYAPKYCSVCGLGSMEKKKLIVVGVVKNSITNK